jgi:CubicO group peptidase (beta-lactamase class C family)
METRPTIESAVASRVDALVREVMESRHVSGLSLAIVAAGEIVWSGAYGYADVATGEAATTGHRYSAMSVTKPVIATALLQLHKRGLFGLDDPANKYLDGAIQNEFEAEAPVTIRQLFTHSSGMPEDISTIMPTGKRTLDEHLRLVARTVRRPGETIVYANWGYDAMGLLIERLSGEPLDVYVQRQVLEPLGMVSSVLGNPREGVPLAKGHIFSEIDRRHHVLPLPNWPVAPASPAGGLFSTAEDLARFIIAHLNGGAGIVSPATTDDMRRVHAPDGAPGSGMGLGWRVTHSNGQRMFCHGGDGAGYTAFAGAYPDQQLGVALLINTGGAQGARSLIANGTLALLAGEAPRNGTSGPDLSPFGGRYRSNFWNVIADVRREADTLTVTVPTGLINAYQEEISRLEPDGDGSLVGRGGMFDGFQVAFREDGGSIRFAGGVYPYVFTRESETIPPEEPTQESAVLTGVWRGTIDTPIGSLAATLMIEGDGTAKVSTPFAQDSPVVEPLAERGLVEGEFELNIPGAGAARMFLRMRAVPGDRLAGKVYARMDLGEVSMQMEMTRE